MAEILQRSRRPGRERAADLDANPGDEASDEHTKNILGERTKERAYHAYQARENYLRMQRGNQRHLEELRTELEQERAAKKQARVAEEQERAAKEQECAAKMEALAEVDRLKKLLEGRSADSPGD